MRPQRLILSLLLAAACLVPALDVTPASGQVGCCVCNNCTAPELFACRDAEDAGKCQAACTALNCSNSQFQAGADCLNLQECFGDCCDAPGTGCSQVPQVSCAMGSIFFAGSYCDGSSCLPPPPPTNTPTNTPAGPTATSTPSASHTATGTATHTATPPSTHTATATHTATPVNTHTVTPTHTTTPPSTHTATATATGSLTPTATLSATPSHTATPANTSTATATRTDTPIPPNTSTATASPTRTVTASASATATLTATPEPSDLSFLIDGATSTMRLVGIPVGGFSYRPAPLKPSLQLLDARGRFCFMPGMLTRLHLDLPAQDCENECTVGIFGSGTASQLNIARLPQIRRAAATFDLLIDIFEPCGEGGQPTTLRMRNAVTYVSCTGDCNGDGAAMIDELMLGVNIALERESVGSCPAHDQDGDGVVRIAELVRAVRNALEGCSSE